MPGRVSGDDCVDGYGGLFVDGLENVGMGAGAIAAFIVDADRQHDRLLLDLAEFCFGEVIAYVKIAFNDNRLIGHHSLYRRMPPNFSLICSISGLIASGAVDMLGFGSVSLASVAFPCC